MSKFDSRHLVQLFSDLGSQLLHPGDALQSLIEIQRHHNPWFTQENVQKAITAIGAMLNPNDLEEWLGRYPVNQGTPKKVGLILAGNIPLVGFHDALCVLASGNFAMIKTSSSDAQLMRYVLNLLTEIEPAFADRFSFVERLENFDAIIATGSNNTSRYFEYYFGKVPNIIRKNRSSVAVLTGTETKAELYDLGHDIFDYFGLGCRNVSKLLVPEGYNFNAFFEAIEEYKPVINHHKYANNYDYNKSVFLVNLDHHLDNGFLLLKEEQKLASPLAVVYFEYYGDIAGAALRLNELNEQIQCVVSGEALNVENQVVGFGQSQEPRLWDYADGVDTMAFLANLS